MKNEKFSWEEIFEDFEDFVEEKEMENVKFSPEEIAEGWKKAQPLRIYEDRCYARGMKYVEVSATLTFMECSMEAYGDRMLFKDKDGNYWESFSSIGD